MENNYSVPITYAVKHIDEKTRAKSRSGGAFTALSDYVLDNRGVVYGCVLNENNIAVHERATTKAERDCMRGSKYVESKLGDTFTKVKQDLDNGTEVMFTGTSCQVAGLKAFLKKEYDNLLAVDILCHGVPSPLVWNKYLEWQEKKYGKVKKVDFRNKKDYGWAAHVETLYFEDGRKKDSKVHTFLFYKHLMLRPSCYECKYKAVKHPGDITLADYWEIDRALPGYNDDKGVSLVMINNDRGMECFNAVKSDLDYKRTEYEKSTQPSMFNPANRPDNRNDFWEDFHKEEFGYIVNKYLKNDFKNDKKQQIKKTIKSLIPEFIRKRI